MRIIRNSAYCELSFMSMLIAGTKEINDKLGKETKIILIEGLDENQLRASFFEAANE